MLGVEDGIMLSSGRQDKAWPRTHGAKARRRLSRTAEPAGLSKIPRSDSKGVITHKRYTRSTLVISLTIKSQTRPR